MRLQAGIRRLFQEEGLTVQVSGALSASYGQALIRCLQRIARERPRPRVLLDLTEAQELDLLNLDQLAECVRQFAQAGGALRCLGMSNRLVPLAAAPVQNLQITY
jgi:anti-anti-sigma regulatory factor